MQHNIMRYMDSHYPTTLSRRAFLRRSSEGLIGAALATALGGLPIDALSSSGTRTRVVIHRNEQATEGRTIMPGIVRDMLQASIEAFTKGGGWPALFPNYRAGDTFGIKVNCLNRYLPSHPEVVQAIVDGLRSMGVPENNIIVWDRTTGELVEGGYTINEDTAGVRVFGTDRWGYDRDRPIPANGGTVYPSKILTQTTHLINVPVLKDHGGAALTFSMKNHLGSIDKPGVIHNQGLHATIAPLNQAPDIREKTRLIVGDALFGVYRGGPGGSPQFSYNGLIVGTDPVAVDLAAKTILDEERANHSLAPVNPRYLNDAADRGLGTNDPTQIEWGYLPEPILVKNQSWGRLKATLKRGTGR